MAESVIIACHAWHQENFGGAYKLAAEFAESLSIKGYDVHFICGTDLNIQNNPQNVKGLKLWRYKYPAQPSPSLRNLYGHIHETKKIAESGEISDCYEDLRRQHQQFVKK